jgi:hypothetical protein
MASSKTMLAWAARSASLVIVNQLGRDSHPSMHCAIGHSAANRSRLDAQRGNRWSSWLRAHGKDFLLVVLDSGLMTKPTPFSGLDRSARAMLALCARGSDVIAGQGDCRIEAADACPSGCVRPHGDADSRPRAVVFAHHRQCSRVNRCHPATEPARASVRNMNARVPNQGAVRNVRLGCRERWNIHNKQAWSLTATGDARARRPPWLGLWQLTSLGHRHARKLFAANSIRGPAMMPTAAALRRSTVANRAPHRAGRARWRSR